MDAVRSRAEQLARARPKQVRIEQVKQVKQVEQQVGSGAPGVSILWGGRAAGATRMSTRAKWSSGCGSEFPSLSGCNGLPHLLSPLFLFSLARGPVEAQ